MIWNRVLAFAVFASALWLCQSFGQDAAPAEKAGPIEVVAKNSDELIEDRIREIFDAVGGFESIGITVKSGVVTLSGEAAGPKVREDAVSLANRTDGVVLTLDRMTEPVEIKSQFAPAFEKLREMGRTFVVKLPLIGAALAILLLTIYFARLVGNRRGWLERVPFSALGKQLVLRVVRLTVVVVGVLIALELLDATAIVGAVLGAAGLAGLALGFAFKNIVENYLAGVLLSTRNPFEIGDSILVDGKEGKVARLTSRDTVLVTFDGNHLRIPNGVVMNSTLINYSRNPKRRFDFEVGVSTEFDLSEVKRIGLEVLGKHPGLLRDPEPLVLVDQLGDSAVVIKFFAWLDQREVSFLKVKSEAIRRIKEAFDENGIEMPEPIYRVHLRDGQASVTAPEAATKLKPEWSGKTPDEEEDLSVDRSIDDQIEDEQKSAKEVNLLSAGADEPDSDQSE